MEPSLWPKLSGALDTPGAVPAGYSLEPHAFGGQIANRYIFAKISPDAKSPRPGMVFSHGLAISSDELVKVECIRSIFTHLMADKPTSIKAQTTPLSVVKTSCPEPHPMLCDFLLSLKVPTLIAHDADQLLEVTASLWPVLRPAMRRELRFGLSLSTDGRDGAPLHLAIVPTITRPQFREARDISKILAHPTDTPVTLAGRALVGDLKPVMDSLLEDLCLDPDFETFGKLSPVAELLSRDLTDFDQVLTALRTVLAAQPDPDTGSQTKRSLIDGLFGHTEMPTLQRLLQLRNLDFASMPEKSDAIEEALSQKGALAIAAQPSADEVGKLFRSLLDGRAKAVWASGLSEPLKSAPARATYAVAQGLLSILGKDAVDPLKALGLVDAESIDGSLARLIKDWGKPLDHIEARIFAQTGFALAEAETLILRHSGDMASALAESIERDQSVFGEVGIRRCLAEMKPMERLRAGLQHDHPVVQEAAIKAVVSSPILLGRVSLCAKRALEIWLSALRREPQSWRIKSSIDETQTAILDELLLQKNNEPAAGLRAGVLDHLMRSPAGNWIDHSRAGEALERLEGEALQSATSQTSAAWIERYPHFQFNEPLLNPPDAIKSHLSGQSLRADLLEAFDSNTIGVGLRGFTNLPGLVEDMFQPYIVAALQQDRNLDSGTALNLGRFLTDQHMQSVTRELFRQFKQRGDMRKVFEIACDHLKFIDAIIHGLRQPSDRQLREEFANVMAGLYPHGLCENEILERAGGEPEKFSMSSHGATDWRRAIHQIHHGARPTFSTLIYFALQDFPQNEELRYFSRVFEI